MKIQLCTFRNHLSIKIRFVLYCCFFLCTHVHHEHAMSLLINLIRESLCSLVGVCACVQTRTMRATRYLVHAQFLHDHRTQQRVLVHQFHRWLHHTGFCRACNYASDVALPLLFLWLKGSLFIPGALDQPRQGYIYRSGSCMRGVVCSSGLN